jgi:hypothetical protein
MADDAPKKQRNLAAERSQKIIFKNPCVKRPACPPPAASRQPQLPEFLPC